MKSLHIALSAITMAALTASLAFSNIANAGQFGVRVVDEAGMPVSGASVCFGLHGSYRQFGTQITGIDGQAVADIPNVPVVVTISKTRFSGIRLNEPARNFNLIKQVTLVEGNPGPRCKAGSILADVSQSSVRVSRVEVLPTGSVIRLKPDTVGEPNEYRLGTNPELESVRWQTFDETIRLPASIAEQDRVFLQLRRYNNVNSNWLEAVSRTVMVYLPASEPSPSL